MFVAITIAKNNLRDSAIAVIESARSRDKVLDPDGRLFTAEALARLRLKTPGDTAEAFRLLQEYVITQPRHGAGFLNTPHWWWEGLRRDKRWNDFLVSSAGK
jgi:hypothetical protein